MFEFVYEEITQEQKEQYLERIGCAGMQGATKENLDKLVYQHQCTVPFEALDLTVKKLDDLNLDGQYLFDKVVTRKRGGFCFELNGIFVLLLRAMGFDAYSCMCRVAMRPTLGNIAHRACIVRLDGKMYVCDVGLGGPMAPFAVELSEEKQTVFGETYWVEKTYEGWLLLKRMSSSGEEANCIIFATIPLLPTDFYPLCRALLVNPDSMFRKVHLVNLRRENGYLNLRDNLLVVTENGVKTEIPVTEENFEHILKEYYDLVV